MENLNYPGNGNGKSTEEQIRALRGFLNEMVDTINYNFSQIESSVNEIMVAMQEESEK